MLIVILNFGGIFGELRAIHALSRAKINIILCEILKTNLCGKLRQGSRVKTSDHISRP